MPIFIDQTGQSVELKEKPKRVISLVPSQSEFLWEIGVKEQLAGITKFCIHPEEMFRSVERIGGTKSLNLDKIRAIKPDLIIGNKEENERSQIEELQKEFPVWVSDIFTPDDSLNMMKELGEITGHTEQANRIRAEVSEALNRVKNSFKGQSLLYFIWREPFMLAGSNTFIDALLNHLGFKNLAGDLPRYPELSLEKIKELNPEFCFLSSEPYPFNEKHAEELKRELPATKIVLVDGEMFSWYGSRLKELPRYIELLKKQLSS